MEERTYCYRCGTSLRRGTIPIVPLTAPWSAPEKSTAEPAWYHLVNV